MHPVVNKWLDFIDRVGWTVVQVSAGVALAAIASDMNWEQVLVTTATAALVATLKVIAGQNTGTDDTGSLIGTSVIEPDVKDTN